VKEARVVLAEAMGLEQYPYRTPGDTELYFQPFTDANDDYAVLEWAKKEFHPDDSSHDKFRLALGILCNCRLTGYSIGDYARAACTVLGIDMDSLNDTG